MESSLGLTWIDSVVGVSEVGVSGNGGRGAGAAFDNRVNSRVGGLKRCSVGGGYPLASDFP